ncbi:MAG: dihydropteroate synthase [Pelolinea sp.]|nr:dihydropteroate synthase [Pelolinea sp.]
MNNVNKKLQWGRRTYIMGIINLTPDSFSGDGILFAKDPIKYALEKTENFLSEGADIIDIGAESSRPGYQPVSASIEIERLLPILNAIMKADLGCIISVDTYKPEVAKQCLENGADWINDIWGLSKRNGLAELLAQSENPVILMHNRSDNSAIKINERLGSSYEEVHYSDFMEEIKCEIKEMVAYALSVGIHKENIIVDPGIGFGKSVEQNLILINHLDEIKTLGYPVLIGPSRKSFIGQILDLPVEERLEGTAASVAVGIARGADVIRVHDVKYLVRIAKMCDALTR